MTEQQIAEALLQSKDVIALILLSALIWFIMTKHIPMILIREEKKAEADRIMFKEMVVKIIEQNKAVESAVEKLGDKVAQAVEHVRESVKDLLVEVLHNNSKNTELPTRKERNNQS